MKFHERINNLKNNCGETQAKIAEALAITPQALSYYLKGREPNYDLLIKMSKYFECTTDYLLGMPDINGRIVEIDKGLDKYSDDELLKEIKRRLASANTLP